MREIKVRFLLKGWKRRKHPEWQCMDFWEALETPRGFCDQIDWDTVGQYIGLKDKNGKEIYGGDITNCGTVEWCECLNWDGGGSTHPGFYFKEKYQYSRGALAYHTGFEEDIEVIGNVYENPELVKEEKV